MDNTEFAECLTALRELTKLNPLAYAKVLRERKIAEGLRDDYIKHEPNDIIGVDYASADRLEYSLRMKALQKSCEREWREYLSTENDGYGLQEYAESVLAHHIEERRTRHHR